MSLQLPEVGQLLPSSYNNEEITYPAISTGRAELTGITGQKSFISE